MESRKGMLPSLMLALPFMLVLELNLSQLDQLLLNLEKMPMPSILMRFDPGMEYKICLPTFDSFFNALLSRRDIDMLR